MGVSPPIRVPEETATRTEVHGRRGGAGRAWPICRAAWALPSVLQESQPGQEPLQPGFAPSPAQPATAFRPATRPTAPPLILPPLGEL